MNSESEFRLEDKTALVTGSSRGIGRAIAEDFAAAGATVMVTARALQDAEAVAGGIRAAGGSAFAVAYDAALDHSQEALAEEVKRRFDRLDILVNNAGILRPHRIEKLDRDEFDEIFAVNTRAAVFLCKHLLEWLRKGSKPSIVNIGAVGAQRPMAGIGVYCASKAAMASFTQTLAKEWMAYGIRVNSLTPGSVATDMILPKDPERRRRFETEMAEQNLMKRLAHPAEIARVARFLASPAASFVTGQTLVVDGGFLA